MKNGEVRADERETLVQIVEDTQDCPTCHEIYALFWNAHEYVMNVASQASVLGQDRGVFLTDPKDFLGKMRLVAERIAEHTGGYYVDSVWLPWLRVQAMRRQTHKKRSAEVLDRLSVFAPPGQVHVVVARKGCIDIRCVTVRGSSDGR